MTDEPRTGDHAEIYGYAERYQERQQEFHDGRFTYNHLTQVADWIAAIKGTIQDLQRAHRIAHESDKKSIQDMIDGIQAMLLQYERANKILRGEE